MRPYNSVIPVTAPGSQIRASVKTIHIRGKAHLCAQASFKKLVWNLELTQRHVSIKWLKANLLWQQGQTERVFEPQPSLQQKQCPHGTKAVDAGLSIQKEHSMSSSTCCTLSATSLILLCSANISLPCSAACLPNTNACARANVKPGAYNARK